MKLNFWMYIRQDKKNDFHSLPLYNALFFSSPFSISVTCSLFLLHPTLRGLFVYFKKLLLVQKLGSSSKYKYIAEEDKGGQAGLLVSPRKRLMLSPGHSPVWELQPAQYLAQESYYCLHHTSNRGWAHSLQIHSQKLFQSSANAEPCGSLQQP